MSRPQSRRGRIFYGWVIVTIGTMTLTASAATAPPIFTQFAMPMTAEFGWSRTLFAGAFSLGTIGVALVSPLVGRLVDRYGARVVITVGAFMLGGALILLGSSSGLVGFYLGYGLGRTLSMGVLGLAATTAVANWFIVKRGRTMAITNMGRGVGASTMPLLAHFIIQSAGWRTAWMALGGLVWGILILPAAIFLRRRPEDMGLRPDGLPASTPPPQPQSPPSPSSPGAAPGSETHWTLSDSLRTPVLWLLTLAMFIRGLSAPGIGVHLKPYLMGRGIAPTTAAAVVSTESAGIGAGGLLWGLVVERLNIRYAMALVLFINATAVVLLLNINSAPPAFLYAVFYGTGLGGIFTLEVVIFADYFGRMSLGSIRGFVMPFQMAGTAMGPLFSGLVYDLTGSYQGAFTVFAIGYALAAATIFFARPPRARLRKGELTPTA